MSELITLAEKLAGLAPAVLFVLMILLLVAGVFRLKREVTKAEADTAAAKADCDEAEKDHEAQIAFREQLRLEAIADRKASDERVEKLTGAVEESNKLTKQALTLMEKILNEIVKANAGRSPRA